MGRRDHARAMATSSRADERDGGQGADYRSSSSSPLPSSDEVLVRHSLSLRRAHISPVSFKIKNHKIRSADNTIRTLSNYCSDSPIAKSLLLSFISLFICFLLTAFGTSSIEATQSTTPPPLISSSWDSPLEQTHINHHHTPHHYQPHHHLNIHNKLASQNHLVRPFTASHLHDLRLHRRSNQRQHQFIVHQSRGPPALPLDNDQASDRGDPIESDWLPQHSSAESHISKNDLGDASFVSDLDRHNIVDDISSELDRTRSHQHSARNNHLKHHTRHKESLSEDHNNDNADESETRPRWRSHLRPTFTLHKYLYHRKQRESNKIHFSELDPISIGQRTLHERGSETKTNIQNNNNNDDDQGGDNVDSSQSSPASTPPSPSLIQGREDLEAASQDKVPERLPIVVSYSDNSYVSASPITKDSGVNRLRTSTSTTQQSTHSTDSIINSNQLIDFRQISDLEREATTTTFTTTATDATTTTATTTAGLIPSSEDLEENRVKSGSISKTNYLSKFTKEAQMWSDFSDGFDFDDENVDDESEQSRKSAQTARVIDRNNQDNLHTTATSAFDVGLDDDVVKSNNDQMVGKRVKFDINEQYHNRPATIIKTRESIEKGATFIKYTIVTNLNACLVECWITESCDTAVYQESPVDFNINNYNDKIINPSPSVTSAQSTLTQTTSDFVTTSYNKHHEEIHQLISPSQSSSVTPSTAFYQSNNYAIESDNNNNNIVYSETKPFNDSSENISYDSHGSQSVVDDTDENKIIGDTNENRPVIFAKGANNDADNHVKDTHNEFEHKRRWFKQDGSDKSHHRLISLEQVNMNKLAEHGFYICYLFECVKEEGFKCEFSPHNFYTSSTKQQAFSKDRRYSSLIRSPANFLYDRDNFDQSTKWPKIHRASIDIGEEDIRKFEQGGLNSAIIAIMFGVGATSMLIFIVGHKMKSIRRRVAYEVRRRSIVPDKDFLINTLTE